MIKHPFEIIFDKNSRILILGSFPSIKSREEGFYYAHSRNRFWKIISEIFNMDVPNSIEEKKELLLDNGIALTDVLESCEIIGSDDNSITNEIPMNLESIFKSTNIKHIYANGNTAYRFFKKYNNKEIIKLPSTSPANARYTLEDLTKIWKEKILNL